jgi:hypothetical protein
MYSREALAMGGWCGDTRSESVFACEFGASIGSNDDATKQKGEPRTGLPEKEGIFGVRESHFWRLTAPSRCKVEG